MKQLKKLKINRRELHTSWEFTVNLHKLLISTTKCNESCYDILVGSRGRWGVIATYCVNCASLIDLFFTIKSKEIVHFSWIFCIFHFSIFSFKIYSLILMNVNENWTFYFKNWKTQLIKNISWNWHFHSSYFNTENNWMKINIKSKTTKRTIVSSHSNQFVTHKNICVLCIHALSHSRIKLNLIFWSIKYHQSQCRHKQFSMSCRAHSEWVKNYLSLVELTREMRMKYKRIYTQKERFFNYRREQRKRPF